MKRVERHGIVGVSMLVSGIVIILSGTSILGNNFRTRAPLTFGRGLYENYVESWKPVTDWRMSLTTRSRIKAEFRG